jgi:hypothetical protein
MRLLKTFASDFRINRGAGGKTKREARNIALCAALALGLMRGSKKGDA